MDRILTVPDGQEARIQQSVSMVTGAEYGVTFYYSLETMHFVNSKCRVSAVYDSYTGLQEIQLTTNLAYQQYTAYFIARKANPTIEIRVSCDSVGNGDSTRVLIDDVRIWNNADSCGGSTPGDGTPGMPALTLIHPSSPDPPLCPKQILHAPSFDPIPGETPWTYTGLGTLGQDSSVAHSGEYFGYETLSNLLGRAD